MIKSLLEILKHLVSWSSSPGDEKGIKDACVSCVVMKLWRCGNGCGRCLESGHVPDSNAAILAACH